MAAHAVVVPFPGRGLLNPMMQLALKLSSRGICVTFVLTESWHKSITQKEEENPFSEGSKMMRAAIIPDCVVEESQRWADITAFLRSLSDMETHVGQVLRDLKASGIPATCIVADLFLSWAVPFAKSHALHSVSLCSLSVTTFSVFYHLDLGLEGWKDYVAKSPPLQLTDFSVHYIPPSPLGNNVVECIDNVRRADWIVANSLYALDCKAVETQRHKTAVHCVGPLNMASSSQLDRDCIDWLDSKPARSVVFVSFGSLHNAGRLQIREIADGLMNSGYYFMWALRPDKEAAHFSEMLPSGYLEECKGRGLIAPWFKQAQVLKHPAVGGFLSHCGWNAVMESVWAGVPMLGFPLAGDQFPNCRLVVEEWKFGIGLRNAEDGNKLISAGEIERKVKMLMEGEEGLRARGAAERYKAAAEEEVSNGGQSATNLEMLVNGLKTF